MDDCNLEKLNIKPGKLTPKFNKETTEYNVVVGSNIDKIIFDCLTSDSGACYCISVTYHLTLCLDLLILLT